ncbi:MULTISPECIES: GatB/YqeY domain-containing protein [unclassified Variovorax]|uniref:GatB/YqeY domain-containing protein n=1 Tax=unclassified Variovorax TaxID=663243 RepID=UPI0013184C97|nr:MULTISPECIES: GatB/YqeY domain-containing protein [unclassified Variovorax]VTU42248.1 hypothetical protein H6P1_00138 [Variovorax sp. PBL-H6]VTU44134.1 hypothetical protein SRS16P1_00764 [Variovorax sp. SRS16]VTU44215.1 hypothetical protein E5P1_00757 [Variovorax sp. PBL-E5]
MSLLQRIKDDSLQARKAKEAAKAATLTTLYSEAAMIGKNAGNRETTDEEVAATVKKFIKNAKEAIVVLENATDDARIAARDALRQEVSVYNAYLPQQLDHGQLTSAILGIVQGLAERSPKQMGAVMKALKEQHGTNYDGSAASAIAKEALASAS